MDEVLFLTERAEKRKFVQQHYINSMPNDTQPTEEQLKQAITESLQKLYDKDENLIRRFGENGETKHVHERSIVFRFGVYFQQIAERCPLLQGYDIDVEYNRNTEHAKCTPLWPNGTYPDFIVHKREQNSTREEPNNNLLILEFKTYWNKNGLRTVSTKEKMKHPERRSDKKILQEKLSCVLDNGCDYRGAVVDYLKILDFMRKNEYSRHQYLYCYGASIIITEQEPPVWCWMDGDAFRREDSVNELPRIVHQCSQPPSPLCSHSGRGKIVCPIYKPVWE